MQFEERCPSVELRSWQERALSQLARHTNPDFLLSATPASGKTTFACTAIRQLKPDLAIIVVPTIPLRRQWADHAACFGLDLDPTFENGQVRPGRDRDGIVVTYAAVASAPHIYRNLSSRQQTKVVLDEIHHCGDEHKWGDAIHYAFEKADRRLGLSGTPFRMKKDTIPFVTYEGDPAVSKPDFSYTYGQALQDGVVRPVEFAFFDGTARWVDAQQMMSTGLSEAGKDDEGLAIRSAISDTSEWMRSVQEKAHATLVELRQHIPARGGLIVADHQTHARRLAKQHDAVTGVVTPLAISDDPRGSDVIRAFKVSDTPWLTAVNMVSEGVDIPRLMVGIYATTSRTELFFRQVVGRFVRIDNTRMDEYPATVYLPSVPSLVEMAKKIEDERNHVLEEEEITRRRFDDFGPGLGPNPITILGAVDGKHSHSVLNSTTITLEEIETAKKFIDELHLTQSPTYVALIIQKYFKFSTSGNPPNTNTDVKTIPDYEVRELKRQECKKLVNRYHEQTAISYREIWIALNDLVGERSVAEATIESLDRRIELLSMWLTP